MPYTLGLLEGFTGARDANLKRQQDQDAATRAQEGRIYEYLLGSHDPEMRALAMSGMLESARPGAKGKGLRGYLGEVQGGSIYPQVLSRMNEQVPDDGPPAESSAPQPGATPGSAGMSTNQPTRPGSAPIGAAGGGMPGAPLPPEPPPEGAGGANDGGAAAGPQGGAQSIVGTPPPPPPSPFKRRGTGVPTAEEIAENISRVEFENKVKTITTAIIGQGGTPEDVKRAVLGLAGAPQSQRQFAAPTFGVKGADGKVHPVSFDYTTGTYAYADGTPVPREAELVRLSGGATMNAMGRVPDTPAGRQSLIAMGADPQELAAGSPTGYWKYKAAANGEILVGPDMYTPPTPFTGTSTIYDANGNPVVVTNPRPGGPPGPANIIGPAVTGQPTAEQSDATALLAEVDKTIADLETPKVPGFPKKPLATAQKDEIVRQRAMAGGLPYTTYLEIQRAARQQRRPSPSPTTPKPAAVPGGGGSALSMADQVRADLLSQQQGAAAVPPPPEAPTRARGAGPVGR